MQQITPEQPMLVFIRLFLKEPDLKEPMGEVPMMLSSSTVCPSTTKRCRMSSVTFWKLAVSCSSCTYSQHPTDQISHLGHNLIAVDLVPLCCHASEFRPGCYLNSCCSCLLILLFVLCWYDVTSSCKGGCFLYLHQSADPSGMAGMATAGTLRQFLHLCMHEQQDQDLYAGNACM